MPLQKIRVTRTFTHRGKILAPGEELILDVSTAAGFVHAGSAEMIGDPVCGFEPLGEDQPAKLIRLRKNFMLDSGFFPMGAVTVVPDRVADDLRAAGRCDILAVGGTLRGLWVEDPPGTWQPTTP